MKDAYGLLSNAQAEGGHDPAATRALRRLWQAVLGEALTLALGGSVSAIGAGKPHPERDAARRWIGGRDFDLVCAFAGYDPDVVCEWYRKRAADTDFDLKAEMRRIGAANAEANRRYHARNRRAQA